MIRKTSKILTLLLLLFLVGLNAQSYCVTGCNSNTYVDSEDPNTLEYDNMISSFHASITKDKNGVFKVWGEVSGSNAENLLKPTVIAPSSIANENFNYTGTPLKVATGSLGDIAHQFAILTTDGLYAWGTNNTLISRSIKRSNNFEKITVNGKADGLPAGVSPTDVKMMFGSTRTLAIVTCTGDAWVLSFNGSKNGDGTIQAAETDPDQTNNVIWHRVKTNATGNPNLTGVVAMRGTPHALFALTSTGDLYTWGTGTFINSGSASPRTYATPITKPAGAIPKMIGMTQNATFQTYYLLAKDGKLYAMGNNSNKQLGNGNGTRVHSDTWIEVRATSGTNTLGGNIVWISPNEHSSVVNTAAINVLTNNNKQWGWGSNSTNMLGMNGESYYDPIYMPGNSTAANGLNLTDEVIAVETGGHTTINVKKCSQFFGYVGHRINGSMGDGTNSADNRYPFTYSSAILSVCGTDVGPKVKDLKICSNTTTNLNAANLELNPALVEWHATNDVTSPVMTNITAVGPGIYYAFYTAASGKCRSTTLSSAVTVSYYLAGEATCNTANCYKPAVTTGTTLDTHHGITSLGRAGSDNGNWPMIRKGAWTALESKTKGFVVNRIPTTTALIAIPNPIEGMMVYDEEAQCLKIYSKTDATTFSWKCFTTPACPD